MPLELPPEKRKNRAAFWLGQALGPTAHIYVDIFLRLSEMILLRISQVTVELQLLVARKIFKVTY